MSGSIELRRGGKIITPNKITNNIKNFSVWRFSDFDNREFVKSVIYSIISQILKDSTFKYLDYIRIENSIIFNGLEVVFYYNNAEVFIFMSIKVDKKKYLLDRPYPRRGLLYDKLEGMINSINNECKLRQS